MLSRLLSLFPEPSHSVSLQTPFQEMCIFEGRGSASVLWKVAKYYPPKFGLLRYDFES
jgi:hypothetical protein